MERLLTLVMLTSCPSTRLSELQDLIDKYNAAATEQQNAILNEIVDFVYDDYRQVLLAAHKRMDIVVGALIMTGKASVKNRDNNPDGIELLNIELPFKYLTPEAAVKDKFISYLQTTLNELKAEFGVFAKMIMSRGTFVKNIVGSPELGDKFKMIFRTAGDAGPALYLVTSDLASQVFTGIGLPAIEIKEDYVIDQAGKNVQIYADDRITLLTQDKIGHMRFHNAV